MGFVAFLLTTFLKIFHGGYCFYPHTLPLPTLSIGHIENVFSPKQETNRPRNLEFGFQTQMERQKRKENERKREEGYFIERKRQRAKKETFNSKDKNRQLILNIRRTLDRLFRLRQKVLKKERKSGEKI